MPPSPPVEQLVVAISSRALFDFEEENQVFETADDHAYMRMQLERLEQPAKPGVAYRLVRKLLAFNADSVRRVEVVILSRNDPVSGLRVFRSVKGAGLDIERGVFTRGRAPYGYLEALKANLFLSANADDVRAALNAGFPAAMVYTQTSREDPHPDEVRIAFDGDAVLFADEAERVYQTHGLDAFQTHEADHASRPLPPGPFKPLLEALHRLQLADDHAQRADARAHGARHRAVESRARTRDPHVDGLEHRSRRSDVPGRAPQGRLPAEVRARFLLRRPDAARRVGGGARAFRARAARHLQRAVTRERRRMDSARRRQRTRVACDG